jgi:hypothetical protein
MIKTISPDKGTSAVKIVIADIGGSAKYGQVRGWISKK